MKRLSGISIRDVRFGSSLQIGNARIAQCDDRRGNKGFRLSVEFPGRSTTLARSPLRGI